MSWIAARRYARALMDIGIQKGVYRQYIREIVAVQEMIEKVPILKATLLNLSFSSKARGILLQRVLEGMDLSKEVVRFIALLVERDRLQQLPMIVRHCHNFMDEAEGQVRASVHSVIPLADDQMVKLKRGLENTLGKKVILEKKVDRELIGGILVKVNNILIDSSLRTQLRQLVETLRKE